MLNKLPSTINSFATTTRSNVNSLIRDMKVGKSELQTLISNLKTFDTGSAFAVSKISPFFVLDRGVFVDMFRDSYLRIQKFFAAGNSVGLALNSMVNVLSSEIEKVEQDIDNYELFINNYNFIAGEDDLYNFNYIEKFNDLLGDYRYDGASFMVPDRDNTSFPVGGNGFIDSAVGVFKFGTETKIHNVFNLIKNLKISSNYQPYISSSSDPMNLFNDNLVDSWNVTIKSPFILTSNLSEYSKYINYDYSSINGAQTLMEVEFNQNIVMDTIRISPNANSNFQLLQISLYDGNTSIVDLLSSPEDVRALKEYNFPECSVNKIIFIFNQLSYVRNKLTPISSELNYKLVNSFVEERINERAKRFSKYQDLVYWFFKKKTNVGRIAKNSSEYDFYSFRFPEEEDKFERVIFEELFAKENFGLDYKFDASKSPIIVNLISNMLKVLVKDDSLIKSSFFVESYSTQSERMLENIGFLRDARSNSEFNVRDQFYNYPIVHEGVQTTINALLINEPKDFYEYLFSIKAIEFLDTKDSQIEKACFVSKKLPNNGQLLGVKAKVDIIPSNEDTILVNYDLDSKVSYELSFSVKESPEQEKDWYPLSFNNQTNIDSEVIFFDVSDFSASLRFHAIVDSVFLYKNGMLCHPSKYTYSATSNKVTLVDTSLYSPSSVFCVKYDLDFVSYNPGELDFVKQNIFNDYVKPYATSSGNGQRFAKSDLDRTVTLDYIPYVNRSLVINSSYSSNLGTIFSAGYSPVRVQLSDGSFAINLTNYTGIAQNVRFYDTNAVMFIQNGKSLVFNRQIDSTLIVFYDYIPSSMRFRFVARRNIPELNTPIKIDNVLLKMKTLSYEPYYDKLHVTFARN